MGASWPYIPITIHKFQEGMKIFDIGWGLHGDNGINCLSQGCNL